MSYSPSDLSANVNLFFTSPVDTDGIYGASFSGVACYKYSFYRSAIIESYYNADVQNAQVDYVFTK
jgi:hypothetical protein